MEAIRANKNKDSKSSKESYPGEIEKKTLSEVAPEIAKALSQSTNLQVFGNRLVLEKLITQSTVEEIWIENHVEYSDVAQRMLIAVADNLLYSPRNWGTLVQILGEMPSLTGAVDHMSTTLKTNRKTHASLLFDL